MSELPMEPGPTGHAVPSTLDGAIRRLWERARLVSELVQQLRSENAGFRSRVEQLESAERRLQQQLQEREEAVRRVESELQQIQNRNGDSIFSKEEQEHIVSTIKELIQKLDSRL